MSFLAISIVFGIGIVLTAVATLLLGVTWLADTYERVIGAWALGALLACGLCITTVVWNENNNYESKIVRQTYEYEGAKFFVNKVGRYKDQDEWKIIHSSN